MNPKLVLPCRLLIPATDFTRRFFAAQKTLAKALVAACGLGSKSAQAVFDWQKVGRRSIPVPIAVMLHCNMLHCNMLHSDVLQLSLSLKIDHWHTSSKITSHVQ